MMSNFSWYRRSGAQVEKPAESRISDGVFHLGEIGARAERTTCRLADHNALDFR